MWRRWRGTNRGFGLGFIEDIDTLIDDEDDIGALIDDEDVIGACSFMMRMW